MTLDDSASHQIVTKLHAILKPFLLRRVKREVEKSLPPKKEYLLSAPLTQQQKKLYDAVIKRQIREFLLSNKDSKDAVVPFSSDEDDEEIVRSVKKGGKAKKSKTVSPVKEGTKRKSELPEKSNKRARTTSYIDESDDENWLDDLDDGTAREKAEKLEEKRFGKSRLNMVKSSSAAPEDGDEDSASGFESKATKKIKSLKLSNMVMQLRKVVNHVGPYSFNFPLPRKVSDHVSLWCSLGFSNGLWIPKQANTY